MSEFVSGCDDAEGLRMTGKVEQGESGGWRVL